MTALTALTANPTRWNHAPRRTDSSVSRGQGKIGLP